MAHKVLPPADYLRQIFSYDPSTGELRWANNPSKSLSWNKRYAGKLIRGMSHGYSRVRIDGELFRAHRIILAMVSGADPVLAEIDHINGVGSDNRADNIRPATHRQNTRNVRRHKDNSTGFKGVYYHKASGLFHATIMVSGKKHSLGYYKTAAGAHEAYVAAARRLHGEFAKAS